jgi:hypothetical protein
MVGHVEVVKNFSVPLNSFAAGDDFHPRFYDPTAARLHPSLANDFDQANAARADRLQSPIVTQCRNRNACSIRDIHHGFIHRSINYLTVDFDMK